MLNGNLIPSNGLVIVTPKGLVLVDTCWDNELTKELLTVSKEQVKQTINN
jgi:metallo-beta-lactamase class B